MKKLVKESVVKEKKRKFSFKKDVPTGKWGHLEPHNNYTIKLDGKEVGSISEVRLRNDFFGKFNKEDDGKFLVMFMVNKKDPMEDKNPNCLWRWVTFKNRFENSEEAKQFILDNAEGILKQFNVHCMED